MSSTNVSTVQSYRMRMVGIRFRGRHGVSDSERALPQDFLVDLEAELPVELLPEEDRLSQVFDYDRLASLAIEVGTAQPCKLLETLARRVAQRILAETPLVSVSVTVTKLRPPTTGSVDSVSVQLMVSRQS